MTMRRLFLLAAPLLATAAAAQTPDTTGTLTEPAGETVTGAALDATSRMTVPVTLSDGTPHSFIVGTAAERTVIARELAGELGLAEGRRTVVHSVADSDRVGTVLIPRLQAGRREIRDVEAPALARANIGAEGILGVDMLRNQRLDLDFRAGSMALAPSTRRNAVRSAPGVITVTARGRLGRLILADADVDGERIDAIIDTGTAVSMGNEALRRRAERSGPLQRIGLIDVTGSELVADYTRVGNVRIGSVRMLGLPVAFADAHIFRELGLTRRPALLIGMDALRSFDRVALDFANKRVSFTMPAGTPTTEAGIGQ